MTINPIVIGFKDTYNSVAYGDKTVASADEYSFKYIPEIQGDYNPDDFWIVMWALDAENRYSDHVTTISGGDYAGNYVNYDGPTYVGKYIFNLVSKGTNPNVTANPSRAYLTVNRGTTDLEWSDPSEIVVEVGETKDLNISYVSDIYNKFNTSYDNEIVKLQSVQSHNNPRWTIEGLKEGTTTLEFSITCHANEWGFCNFYDSPKLRRTIKVVSATAISNTTANANNIGIMVAGQKIVIENKGTNDICRIYNAQGKLVLQTADTVIGGLQHGLYINKGWQLLPESNTVICQTSCQSSAVMYESLLLIGICDIKKGRNCISF